MDDDQSGRGDLTDWAHKMWATSANSREWGLVSECLVRVRAQGHKAPLVSAFTHPDMYPEFIEAVFCEYAARKLLGEIT